MKAKWWVRLWAYLLGLPDRLVFSNEILIKSQHFDTNGKLVCELDHDCTRTDKEENTLFIKFDSKGNVVIIRRVTYDDAWLLVSDHQKPTQYTLSNHLGVTCKVDARVEESVYRKSLRILNYFYLKLPNETMITVDLRVDNKVVWIESFDLDLGHDKAVDQLLRMYALSEGYEVIVSSTNKGKHNTATVLNNNLSTV